jgi:arylsulfatase
MNDKRARRAVSNARPGDQAFKQSIWEGKAMERGTKLIKAALALGLGTALLFGPAFGQAGGRVPAGASTSGPDKPNILFIMGDDIGWMQPSIYHRGLMVGETPNIDRIGQEGAMFVDYVEVDPIRGTTDRWN